MYKSVFDAILCRTFHINESYITQQVWAHDTSGGGVFTPAFSLGLWELKGCWQWFQHESWVASLLWYTLLSSWAAWQQSLYGRHHCFLFVQMPAGPMGLLGCPATAGPNRPPGLHSHHHWAHWSSQPTQLLLGSVGFSSWITPARPSMDLWLCHCCHRTHSSS